ncbi:MAG: DUF2649 family protein [Spiroplasma sp.]
MKWLDDFYQFLIQALTFIPKAKVEDILATQLSNNDYYLICVGIWLVLIVLLWFVLWMTFKIWGYWK